jgi:hypothetical protein
LEFSGLKGIGETHESVSVRYFSEIFFKSCWHPLQRIPTSTFPSQTDSRSTTAMPLAFQLVKRGRGVDHAHATTLSYPLMNLPFTERRPSYRSRASYSWHELTLTSSRVRGHQSVMFARVKHHEHAYHQTMALYYAILR